MTTANDMQVGGDHYKAKTQHWDFAIVVLGNRYLEGNLTKYVARHRKKGGLQDLKKARHYLNKLIESTGLLSPPAHASIIRSADTFTVLGRFCDENELDPVERKIMFLTAAWRTPEHLATVGQLIDQLIAQAEEDERASDARKAGGLRLSGGFAEPGPGYIDQDQ